MIWYLLNIVVITIVWLSLKTNITYTAKLNEKVVVFNKNGIYCFIASSLWILLSGLRGLSVGADTLAYKLYDFDPIKTRSWEYVLGRFADRYIDNIEGVKDPSFLLIVKIFQIFSDNYQLFLILIAVIFFIPFGLFVYKNSKNPHLSFLLFSCLFFEFFAVTGHRQTIATAIAFFGGYVLIKKKKWLAYIIVVLLASTVHFSAICILPFYWLSKIKINKLTLIVYWIATGFAYIFRNKLLDLLKFIVDNEAYNMYAQTESASVGTFVYLLIAVGIVITMFHKNLLNYDTENGTLIINAIMLAVFFTSLLLINESFMRIVQYYSLYLVLLLPDLECLFRTPRDKQIYRLAAGALLVFLLVNKNPHYVFFWQG